LRRYSAALSMSASVSTSALLQSDMPAPVRSRRSLIICAVTSLPIAQLSSVVGREKRGCDARLRAVVAATAAALVVRRRGGLGRGQVGAAARDDLDLRTFAARRHADRLRLLGAAALLGARGALLVGALAADLLAEHARVRHLARE